jgi:TetR/AcrR family transcriptional regulator, transcriptional repressor of bet genes
MPGKKESEELRREQIIQAAFRVATREGLEQLTVRLVAAEAGLSTGLVFFHFKSKEALLLALLGWLLDSLFENWEISENLSPAERLLILLRFDLQDLHQYEQGSTRLELFFAYWSIAIHDPIINERIQQAMERTRQVLLLTAQEVIASEPDRFRQVTAEGLVTVILAIVQGSAMQSILSDQRVNVEQILAVMRLLLLPPS